MTLEEFRRKMHCSQIDTDAIIDRLHAAERERDALRERLQFDPGGSDKIDELEACIEFLRHEEDCDRTPFECPICGPWMLRAGVMRTEMDYVELLRSAVLDAERVLGCGDNSCAFAKPLGAGTNGGCVCLGRGGNPGAIAAAANLFLAAKVLCAKAEKAPLDENCIQCGIYLGEIDALKRSEDFLRGEIERLHEDLVRAEKDAAEAERELRWKERGY